MVVLSNHSLGPAVEVLVSNEVAARMLLETAEAARPLAQGRWEHELVLWLEDRARKPGPTIDVGELAWSPDNFERQRRFVIDAIARAAVASEHVRALTMWSRQIEAHPREHVSVGRRWRWTGLGATA